MLDIKFKNLAKEIAKYMKEDKPKTSSYDTQAVVRRIEGNTAYVHIPGGIDETPVSKTIAAQKGDIVQVRVSGKKAFLVGNASAPPTDDTTAIKAETKATVAKETADGAESIANGAQVIATTARTKADEAETKAENALEQVGASITTDTLHYLATDLDSGVTTSTPGWTTTVQAITSALPYLWTYHTYHKASGQSVNTQPVITGVYGDTGATGPQGPSGQQGEQGPAGSDGDDGISVTAVQPQYHLHTSPTATPSEIAGWTWSNQLVYESGKYIWTHDYITYSNNSHSSSEAIYNQALTEACSTSEQALNVAEGIDEHFWYDNTGAHVTEDTQEDYQQDPSSAGGNTLMTSQGMAIRKGTTELASFSANNGIIIGKTDEIHVGINDARGLSFYKPNETDTKAYISPIVTQGNLGLYLNSNTPTLTRSYNADIEVASSDYKAMITLSTSESTTGGRASISIHHDGTVYIVGNIDAAGKATLGAINGDSLFDYTHVSMTSASIGANASGEVTSSASNKAKYYPIAITNVSVATGVASLRRFYFGTQQAGRATVTIGVQNDGSSAKTISVNADILWVKISV